MVPVMVMHHEGLGGMAHQTRVQLEGLEEGAALPAVYLTSWFALHYLAHPRPGDRVLIHSAAGGVGSTLSAFEDHYLSGN